jgi:hypothetical protein
VDIAMKMAYADPPYPGQAKKHYGKFGGSEVDHRLLVAQLELDYPDGWALSTSEPALRDVLNLCPKGVRVMPWVKPFASFKPGVNPAYAWEPVIVWGGRRRTREEDTVRDWVSANITMQTGMPGAKPEAFSFWLFSVLNLQPGDEFVDLFPGSGAVSKAWERWCRQLWVA